jgi:hypothetical protein
MTPRAYDVRELIGEGDNATLKGRMEALKGVVTSATRNQGLMSVASFESKLVVTAQQSIHQQVAEVLDLLRAQPATQRGRPQPSELMMEAPQPAF